MYMNTINNIFNKNKKFDWHYRIKKIMCSKLKICFQIKTKNQINKKFSNYNFIKSFQ